jgi:hypothetical protein
MNNEDLKKSGHVTPKKEPYVTLAEQFERDKEEILKPTNKFLKSLKIFLKFLFDLIGFS